MAPEHWLSRLRVGRSTVVLVQASPLDLIVGASRGAEKARTMCEPTRASASATNSEPRVSTHFSCDLGSKLGVLCPHGAMLSRPRRCASTAWCAVRVPLPMSSSLGAHSAAGPGRAEVARLRPGAVVHAPLPRAGRGRRRGACIRSVRHFRSTPPKGTTRRWPLARYAATSIRESLGVPLGKLSRGSTAGEGTL